MTARHDLFTQHRNPVFVETGTYHGDGVRQALAAGFRHVHSIELGEHFYHAARVAFADEPRVHLHLGDSGARLAEIIAPLSEPITFWLDGHYSAGNTARGPDNCPLLRELDAISRHIAVDPDRRRHTLLIDDVRCFGSEQFDGVTHERILEAVHRVRPDYTITYADGHQANDILVATPPRPPGLKILHAVEFYDPSVGGAQAVVKELSERLVARGHDVTVATTALPERKTYELNGVRIAGFNVRGNYAHGIRGDQDTYQRFLQGGDFDVFMTYAAQQWTVDAAWGLIDRLPYACLHCPCGFSGLNDPAYAAYFARLPRLLRRYDQLIFHSDTYQDRAFCDSHGLQDLSVTIPNAAAAELFPPPNPVADADLARAFRADHGIPQEGPLLLTVGTHTGLKGHDLTLAAFRKLETTPAHLLIIGNGTPNTGCYNACHRGVKRASRAGRTARTLDLPRDQVVAAFRAADLFVFPSRVECSPLVLFECLAAGLPFISSTAGNSAEIAAWSNAGLICPCTADGPHRSLDPAQLAAMADTLLADVTGRAAMATAGRAAFDARFDWQRVTDAYESHYRAAVAARVATA